MTREDAVARIWSLVGDGFALDDGSLVSVDIEPLSPAGVVGVYALLRGRGRLTEFGRPPAFWCTATESDVPVDAVPDAAAWVVDGRAEAFHIGLAGVTAAGVELPQLGLFVNPDSVEIDYRPGPDWDADRVAAFFVPIRDCLRVDPAATVRPHHTGMVLPTFCDWFARAVELAAHVQ